MAVVRTSKAMIDDLAQCPVGGWTDRDSDPEADGEGQNCPVCDITMRED